MIYFVLSNFLFLLSSTIFSDTDTSFEYYHSYHSYINTPAAFLGKEMICLTHYLKTSVSDSMVIGSTVHKFTSQCFLCNCRASYSIHTATIYPIYYQYLRLLNIYFMAQIYHYSSDVHEHMCYLLLL